ncbi:MAG TPA: hypothetical protein VFO77_00420, partial [Actinoplanes sp.]|nr:hypothetical protein [Actinoplanes sp.]
FGTCGDGLCPTEQMCWGGITVIAGKVIPPRRKDCTAAHYMQTFAALPLPDEVDLSNLDLDAVLDRADVKSVCSRAAMQARSKDKDRTAAWTINAWPIPTPEGSSTHYLHCVAGNGETRGAAFQP